MMKMKMNLQLLETLKMLRFRLLKVLYIFPNHFQNDWKMTETDFHFFFGFADLKELLTAMTTYAKHLVTSSTSSPAQFEPNQFRDSTLKLLKIGMNIFKGDEVSLADT